MSEGQRPSIVVVGAPDDTSNQGVTALGRSMVAGVRRYAPDVDLTMFDFALGRGREIDGVRRVGLRHGRRYHRVENVTTARWLTRLRVPIGPARALHRCCGVLDVGGGDSFADLYGPEQYRLIADGRWLALEARAPLVLMPQTYGPFADPRHRDEAAAIIRRSHLAWARDPGGFEVLQELLGDHFDPDRHRLGVDVAFGLEPRPPEQPDEDLEAWLAEGGPVVGLNVSGLVYNDDDAAIRFGHRADYRSAVDRIVAELLANGLRVLFVPHVHAPLWSTESDRQAANDVVAAAGGDPNWLRVAPDLDAQEVKWLISRLDWFCGTRMHATIAALSTATPCATVAYSLKAVGVFASCGMGDQVADARHLDTDEVVATVVWSALERENVRKRLVTTVPGVIDQAHDQLRLTLVDLGIID